MCLLMHTQCDHMCTHMQYNQFCELHCQNETALGGYVVCMYEKAWALQNINTQRNQEGDMLMCPAISGCLSGGYG